jgi:hypothetical protein
LFLEVLLENYACGWPGESDSNDTRFAGTEKEGESMFDAVIKKAVTEGSAYDSYSSADLAYIIYSG